MYQAKFVKSLSGVNQAAMERFIVDSRYTVNKGDFVKVAAGYCSAAAAGEKIIGMANETVVGDGTKTVEVIVDPLAVYAMDNDNTGTTMGVTHTGTYFDITGGTGAQIVDTSTTSATTGQLLLVKYNPNPADTSIGHYVIAESQLNANLVS